MLGDVVALVLLSEHPCVPLILFVGGDGDAGVCYSEPKSSEMRFC